MEDPQSTAWETVDWGFPSAPWQGEKRELRIQRPLIRICQIQRKRNQIQIKWNDSSILSPSFLLPRSGIDAVARGVVAVVLWSL